MDHNRIKEILSGLLTALALPFENISITEEQDFIRIDLNSPHASRLIGWHGETLNALQHLLKSIVREANQLSRAPFLILDVDGYRRLQEEKVCRMAEQKADFVRRTGARIALPPMNPYLRRMVHLHIAGSPTLQDLTTESTGEGDYRQVVLRLKEDQKAKESSDGELAPIIEDTGLDNLDV
ncbi:KH domain-containing protein [Candidatus Peregrinibacteria bacterium]|nr:KH domain-containing protein [Candidatus Peregrinibacteria bacterium]